MDRFNAVLAEIKAWYAIVWNFLMDVFAKADVDTTNIPEWLYPEA